MPEPTSDLTPDPTPKSTNPYSAPVSGTGTDQPRRRPRILNTILLMPVLAFVLTAVVHDVARPWIRSRFQQDPAYRDFYLPNGVEDSLLKESGQTEEEYIRARLTVIADRYATASGGLGFLAGLMLPWVRYIWLIGRHPKTTDVAHSQPKA